MMKKQINLIAIIILIMALGLTNIVHAQIEGSSYGINHDILVVNADRTTNDAALRLETKYSSWYRDWVIWNNNVDGTLSFGLHQATSAANRNTFGNPKMTLFADGRLRVEGRVQSIGKFESYGGSMINVMDRQNGGAGRGIFMWAENDTNWGMYMGQPGSGRALDGGTAVAGYKFTSHAFRFRVNNNSAQGFIWENGSDQLLMSLRGSDGLAYIKGKLHVEGGVLSTDYSMGAKANWPDYVFADSYSLKPLTEVESYINENSHLPEVPSAKEVGEKGYDLHEMNVLLLQKIEELTLYTIEQQKQITNLQDQMEQVAGANEANPKSK